MDAAAICLRGWRRRSGGAVQSVSEQPGKNQTAQRFIAIAVLLGAIVLTLLCSAVGTLVQNRGMRPALGWQASPSGGDYVIWSVDRDSAAAALLKPGDVVISINSRAVHRPADPATSSITSRVNGTYTLAVRRGAARLQFNLPFRLQYDFSSVMRAISLLVVALAFFTTGMLIGLSKPALASLRVGSCFCLACAVHMIGVALRPFAGDFTGAELYLYVICYSVSFYQYALGFHFATLFPAERRPELFRKLRLILYTVTVIISTPRALLNLTIASDSVRNYLFQHYGTPIGVYLDYRLIVEAIFQMGTIVGVIYVLVVNYRLEPTPTGRRRLRWVAAGTAVALVPITLFAVLQVIVASERRNLLEDPGWNGFNQFVNASFGLVPITIAYAVLRQRLFDLDVIVRSGARYLIAKSVLRAIFAVPFVAVVWMLIAHRDQPLSTFLRQVSPIAIVLWMLAASLSIVLFRRTEKWLDRRFFRGGPDRDAVLVSLGDAAERNSDAVGTLQEITMRLADHFFPKWITTYYAESGASRMTLASHSGAVLPPPTLPNECTVVSPGNELRALAATGCYSNDCTNCCFGENRPVLVLPILNGTRSTGWILMGEKLSEEPYTKSERMLLDAVGMQLSLVLQRAWLREAVERECRIRMEILSRLSVESEILRECPNCGLCYDGNVERCVDDDTATILTLPITRVIDGKYRLQRRVGRGSSGIVFEADDLKLSRRVAVKIMVGNLFGNPKAQKRFEREARSSAKLNHPNIVTVFDYGTVSGGTYIVMELLKGVTWRSALLLRRPKPGLDEVLRWSFELLDGVEAAHATGVLHRDLKPENAIICAGDDGRERLKLVDFGIAKAIGPAGEAETTLTETDLAVGTPAYMAPEQLDGEPLDERADIYSIGVILSETLLGVRPRAGETLVPEASAIAAGLTPALIAVLNCCLERNPTKRYRTIAELRRELATTAQSISHRSAAHS